MKLIKIKELLEAEVLSGEDNLDIEVSLGCAADLMSDILAFGKPDSILLTGLTNLQVINTANISDMKAICFVRGKKPDEDIIKAAKRNDLVVLFTNLPMFETCGRLYEKGLKGLGYLGIDQ